MNRLACAVVWLVFAGCEKPTQTTFTNGGAETPAERGRTYHYTFVDDPSGSLPASFINVLGQWSVTSEGALVQGGSYRRPDFPRVVLRDLVFEDFTMSVRCRPDAGSVDQACGLMFRLTDSDNYLITRANALEGNVRLYRVVRGDRQQLASAEATVTKGAWQALGVVARGDSIAVRWNGVDVITARDSTVRRGKVGLWTKADSVTAFDNLEVTAE